MIKSRSLKRIFNWKKFCSCRNEFDCNLSANNLNLVKLKTSQPLNYINFIQSRNIFISSFNNIKIRPGEDDERIDDEEIKNDDNALLAMGEASKKELTEEEIEKIRNKSRLQEMHYRFMNGLVPYSEPKNWTHKTTRYRSRMYGLFGEKSGINPGVMWPTKKELDDRCEYESVAFPLTIQELIKNEAEKQRLAKEAYEARAILVEKNMEKMEQYKANLMAKKLAKENEIKKAKDKKEKLMEEVRRHFGYKIDPKDEKFQELLEKKEKDQKKAEKEAKKLERHKKLIEQFVAKEIVNN